MADNKDNARNELTYVSITPPASGAAARLSTNYTKVGLVISDNLALSRNMISADDKDAGEFTNVIPGRTSGTIALQANRAKDGNAGWTILRDAFYNGTLLYFLKTDNIIGDEAVYGTAYVESYEENSDDEAVRTVNASLVIQGVVTFFTIAT